MSIKKNMLFPVQTVSERDALLTDFGKATLGERYCVDDETFQDVFARPASFYAKDQAHADRMYGYISKHWFMPATPVISNGGTTRGLPISCFVNEAGDSMPEIVATWNENIWLASKGGGIGSYWGNIRSIGEAINGRGKTSGVIPFIVVINALTMAISQGSLRRGSAAVYMPIWHPEIEEFIEMRRPTGGDPARKALNLHHGVVISDAFMRAVENDDEWVLRSPVDQSPIRTLKARALWIRILTARLEQGEPYILYEDTVNRARAKWHKEAGLYIRLSNLCSEITLPTGIDNHGRERTGVCCLSSLNLIYWDEFKDDYQFFYDVMLFLDNVIQDFIDNAPPEMANAIYSAMRERSVGLGVMGWHSLLQNRMLPFESVEARGLNIAIFTRIEEMTLRASVQLAEELGPCPDAKEFGYCERFSHRLAIAPTATISIIAGNASPGIEPWNANVFLQKTLAGSFTVKNKALENRLSQLKKNTDEVWSSITLNKGSVQHLDFLSPLEKEVFKTAWEINPYAIIDQAGDRAANICQAQSVNLFLPAAIHKRDLHRLHYLAWKKGLKSLYYCRSLSIQRADAVSDLAKKMEINVASANNDNVTGEVNAPEVCESCQ